MAAPDAAPCKGISLQSYGTSFEVVTYDTNNHTLPLLFARFVECWKVVLDGVQIVDGFDNDDRATIVDQ